MIDTKRLIGSPWTLLNISDFFIIGLMSLLFMLSLQVLGMGWHRWGLWRCYGSQNSPNMTPPANPQSVSTATEGS